MPRLILSIARWLIGLILLGLLIWNPFFLSDIVESIFPQFADEGTAEGTMGALGLHRLNHYIFAAVVAIGAILLLKDVLVTWISYPIRDFLSNIFYPNETVIPPPNYNVATLYRDQGRLDEAMEVYLGILKHHPQETLAYIEGIQTAFDAQQPETAEKIAGMASRLSSPELQQHVASIYQEARSEYDLRPREEPLSEETATGEGTGEDLPR